MSNEAFKTYEEQQAFDQQQAEQVRADKIQAEAIKKAEREIRVPRNEILSELKAGSSCMNLKYLHQAEEQIETQKETLAGYVLELELTAEFISPEQIRVLKKKTESAYLKINEINAWVNLYADNKKKFSQIPKTLSKSIFGDAAESLQELLKDVRLEPSDIAQKVMIEMGKPVKASLTHITTRG